MVSKRNYFMMSIIMVIVVFLFVFASIAQKRMHNYKENGYAADTVDKDFQSQTYNAREASDTEQIVFIGKEGRLFSTVYQWTNYAKKAFVNYKTLTVWTKSSKDLPFALVIDAKAVDWNAELSVLETLTQKGVNLIFCSLPDYEIIKQDERIQKLLGITGCVDAQVELEGVKLYKGFLLGGDRLYTPENVVKPTQQDLQLQIPWYITQTACKIYMVGVPENEEYKEYKNENYPSIMWRASVNNAKVFAVNGSYLQDNFGIGFLSAMEYEMESYVLYPIVNAQNLSVLNYPDLINENSEFMYENYSMDANAVYRDIVLPDLAALRNRLNIKITSFFTTKMREQENANPSADYFLYYAKAISEQDGELGISLSTRDSKRRSQKQIDADDAFVKNQLPDYVITAWYTKDQEYEDITEGVQTLVEDTNLDKDWISVNEEGCTVQQLTCDVFRHTFSEDIALLSIETALGYSNPGMDIAQAVYPSDSTVQFTERMKDASSYLSTYWKPFSQMDKTTITESDARIRTFLALDYKETRKDNTIHLQISNGGDACYFMFRTHGEAIEDITGADYTKIEENSYLLQVYDSKVTITLQDTDHLQFYK